MKTVDKGKTNDQKQTPKHRMDQPKCLRRSCKLKTLKSSPCSNHKSRKTINVVVYLEKLPLAFAFKTFKIPKTPRLRKGYIIPKIRKGYYRLNENQLKYTGLKK